jgi:hypothetical protein
MYARDATDLRNRWHRCWRDSTTGRCSLETQGLDELLQEERDAVI